MNKVARWFVIVAAAFGLLVVTGCAGDGSVLPNPAGEEAPAGDDGGDEDESDDGEDGEED